MEHFNHSLSCSKGTYQEFRIGQERLCATITCPNCGATYSLVGHRIASNGIVNPMVTCTTLGCSFHDEVLLRGWNKLNHDFLTQVYKETGHGSHLN